MEWIQHSPMGWLQSELQRSPCYDSSDSELRRAHWTMSYQLLRSCCHLIQDVLTLQQAPEDRTLFSALLSYDRCSQVHRTRRIRKCMSKDISAASIDPQLQMSCLLTMRLYRILIQTFKIQVKHNTVCVCMMLGVHAHFESFLKHQNIHVPSLS